MGSTRNNGLKVFALAGNKTRDVLTSRRIRVELAPKAAVEIALRQLPGIPLVVDVIVPWVETPPTGAATNLWVSPCSGNVVVIGFSAEFGPRVPRGQGRKMRVVAVRGGRHGKTLRSRSFEVFPVPNERVSIKLEELKGLGPSLVISHFSLDDDEFRALPGFVWVD